MPISSAGTRFRVLREVHASWKLETRFPPLSTENHSCERAEVNSVMTVTGEVAGSELGVALPLEHLLIDLVRDSRVDGPLNEYACLRSNLREAVAPAN